MTTDEAQKCFRDLGKYGCFQASSHCKKRMLGRNIFMDDVLNVLKRGEVTEIGYNEERESWKCKVVGPDIEGDDLVFIAEAFENCQTVRCITVY